MSLTQTKIWSIAIITVSIKIFLKNPMDFLAVPHHLVAHW